MIFAMKWAHASEIAARYAYEGHLRSLRNEAQRHQMQLIIQDEVRHVGVIQALLWSMDSRPSSVLDFLGLLVGKTIGTACSFTGWTAPMRVAGWMERIGHSSYEKLARTALMQGRPYVMRVFLEMAETERQHEEWFERIVRSA